MPAIEKIGIKLHASPVFLDRAVQSPMATSPLASSKISSGVAIYLFSHNETTVTKKYRHKFQTHHYFVSFVDFV